MINLFDKNGKLSIEALGRIKNHHAGSDGFEKRTLRCHYCRHKAIEVYSNARGHVDLKCRKCNADSTYNVVMCRGGVIEFEIILA